jgi:hypothetical protein
MIRDVHTPDDLLTACDTSQIERVLRQLGAHPEYVRKLQGTVTLSFDIEAPVVCQEPRVRAFLRAAHERVPHLWYYLVPDEAYGNLLMFFAVFAAPETVKVEDGKFAVQPGQAELALLLDRLAATARFAAEMADDARRILSEILAPMPEETRAALLAGALNMATGHGRE